MFLNIDNDLGLLAVTQALNSRQNQFPSTECIVEAVKICLAHNNSSFGKEHYLQIHGTAMGPKNACSYADLAMGIIDERAKSGEIKPYNLWWRYRDDIYDLWTQGTAKLLEFTDFINSLYPTIKFTLVYSEVSLNVLDLTLTLVDGLIQTDVYTKPTDNHLYLQRKSAHPDHCIKAIPFGVATRLRRNCSTEEDFDKRSNEYQKYLTRRGYHPNNVIHKQFNKAKSISREELLQHTKREKIILFPLVVVFNPRLPDIGKFLKKHFHLIQDSSELQEIFPPRSIIPSFRRPKTIKEILSTKRRQETSGDQSPKGCYKCGKKYDFCNNYMHESNTFVSSQTGVKYPIKQNIRCNSQTTLCT